MIAPKVLIKTDPPPTHSLIITAHNEGAEVQRTLESVRDDTLGRCEILVVDDGSTDGSCDFIEDSRVTLIRRRARAGVASSRHLAAAQASGDVLVFLDAHQRIEPGALEQCAELALAENAIVVPDLCDFDDDRRIHGAYFVDRGEDKWFSAEWKLRPPKHRVTEIDSLRAPAYALPRHLYPKLRWSQALRGWGGTEAALSLKAFFAGVEILHLCGPMVRHKFKRTFHYDVGWQEVRRNQALIARLCFSEHTWRTYWRPEIFEPLLAEEVLRELDSDPILAERDEFARHKVRPDEDYWTRLIFRPVPESLRSRHREPAGVE